MIEFYPLVVWDEEGYTDEWLLVQEHIGIRWCEDTTGIVAVDATGKMAGICVFDTWSRGSVQVHIWITNPFAIKAGFLTEISNYAFGLGGVESLIGLIPADNEKALNFDEKIGFTEVYRVKDGHAPGVDTVVMQMLKEDCRWLTIKEESASYGR